MDNFLQPFQQLALPEPLLGEEEILARLVKQRKDLKPFMRDEDPKSLAHRLFAALCDSRFFPSIHDRDQRTFLFAFLETLNVGAALLVAGVDRHHFLRWTRHDPTFGPIWDEAWAMAGDLLESEAFRRAYYGVLKPVYHQGQRVGSVREYSDALTTFLMKGAKPERYQDRVKVEGELDLVARLAKGRERVLNGSTGHESVGASPGGAAPTDPVEG